MRFLSPENDLPDFHLTDPAHVYLLRHGQTDSNRTGMLQGRVDTHLNATGRGQAALVGEALREVPLDSIYSSPLHRAQETAAAIAAWHPEQGIETDARLAESDGGDWETLRISEIREQYPETWRILNEEPARYAAPHGESSRDIYWRALSFWSEMLPAWAGQNVAVISHGFLLTVLYNYLSGRRFAELMHTVVVNTAITECLVYGSREVEVLRFGDARHLGLQDPGILYFGPVREPAGILDGRLWQEESQTAKEN